MDVNHSHAPDAIARRLARGPRINYLRDWVYGGIDGAITTFAIVAGAIGADLSARVVIILGAANILADGFSMAAANFTGSRAEIEDYQRIEAAEEAHIRDDPEGEREEIRQIFAAKGLVGENLEAVVEAITSRKDLWLSTMMSEEHGLPAIERSPAKAAWYTFAAFMACGSVPLLPFFLGLSAAPIIATVATMVVFFAIGALKSRWSNRSWFVSGTETALIGMGAAALAWTIGRLLESLV